LDWLFRNKYKLWVINTTESPKLYLWDNWKPLFPNLNSLIGLSKNTPYIRSHQAYEDKDGWLGFGRMQWSRKNNIKWTSKYRNNEIEQKGLLFFDMEVWAPDWNQCVDRAVYPDIYIKLYHHKQVDEIKEGILIAIPKKIAKKNHQMIESNVREIQQKIPKSTLSIEDRLWLPDKKFPNRIEDMNPRELAQIIHPKL